MAYDALLAETVTITGDGGDPIEAYAARPLTPGPLGGVLVIHHMPGYDVETKEIVRRFASEGYNAICPNLHFRDAPGASSDDAAAASRASGGVPDARFLGDAKGAIEWLRGLSNANGKVGCIGYCSGGRQSFLAACNLEIDASVDCYGAFVVGQPPEGMGVKMTPVLDQAPGIRGPMLGLFGKDDKAPTPEQVVEIDARLTELGKAHEFHSYEGAGHAFFAVDRESYRPTAAQDGWEKIFAFYGKHLAGA